MTPWLAYLLGLSTPLVGAALVIAWVEATAPVGWECRDCGWSTGRTWALAAWVRLQWHVHVTRRTGRCSR